MKIEEVVRKFQEDYLKGKTQEEREAFFAKDIKRQYGNIQAWKRRSIVKASREELAPEDIVTNLKCAIQHIKNLTKVSDKELGKISREIDNLRELVDDFGRIRRENQLKELRQQQRQLERMISDLENVD
ncbi:MAG: hypothetical protein NC097_06890 [Clostridium sp.]|nr:hypothetical protein [Prevotella sp.]MCM1429506.1 hypothetical protein [Clostridium sp.]MCM1476122.1 hypothetical protein [Muribaculaceae bacterium]